MSIMRLTHLDPTYPPSLVWQTTSTTTTTSPLLANVRQYMLLALIYDFMAFSAQVYRTILRHRPPSLKQLLSACAAIQQVRGTVRPEPEFANLIKIMLCIADTVMPNPYIPPSPSRLLSPRPSALVMHHPRHSYQRRTCLRLFSSANV